MDREEKLLKGLVIMLAFVTMVFTNLSAVAVDGLDSNGRIIANFGSPVIDGQVDDVWETAQVVTPQYITEGVETSATFRVLWDDNALYILAEVKDEILSVESGTPYMQDSFEVFLDEKNDKTREFGIDDLQFRLNYKNVQTADKGDIGRFYTSTKETGDGYIVETRVALRNKAEEGQIMGMELQVNDAVGANRTGTINVFDSTGMAWDDTDLFGEVILVGKEKGAVSSINPYDMINLLKETQNIDLDLYKNYDIIQKGIDQQYKELLKIIDSLEYTEEAANEKWFVPVPEEYKLDSEVKGKIKRLNYKSVNAVAGTDTKPLNVYLPHNYDANKKYNILYLIHGNSENVNTALGDPAEDKDKELKIIIDNMISKGDIEPLIIVTPTYYAGEEGPATGFGITAEEYYKEVINEVIPFVESKYSTYADSTDREGLKASREHRAFGGFSRGSMTTWNVFENCLDYIKYYTPFSGGAGFGEVNPVETAEKLADVVKESGYTSDDFYLFCANGTDDLTFNGMSAQIDAMEELDMFKYSSDPDKGNFYFMVAEGAGHTWYWVNQYIYNILPDLFVN